MSNVHQFPGMKADPSTGEANKAANGEAVPAVRSKASRLFSGVVRFIWVVAVLIWPVGKWLLSVYVFFSFGRMIYHWNTPGEYAGWIFVLHFSIFTALTYFVSVYKPKGV